MVAKIQEMVMTPVGRLVGGSLYSSNAIDNFTKIPYTFKSGANQGQPQVRYYFYLAIPKGKETHWKETGWGEKIWSVGAQAFGAAMINSKTFSWKIDDGDDVSVRGETRICDREGWAGHWILNCGARSKPEDKPRPIYNANGTALVADDFIVRNGYYVQVSLNAVPNGADNKPGIYLFYDCVYFAAYGQPIESRVPPSERGAGQCELPAGASLTPIGSMPVSGSSILDPDAPVVLPKALQKGLTYEKMRNLGWSDDEMRKEGYIA